MTNGYRYVGPQGIKNYSSGGGGGSTTSFPSIGEINDPSNNVSVC